MEECWAQKADVGRSKLQPASFFKNFGERGKRNSYITTQEERIRGNLHYNGSEELQYKVWSSHETLTPAGLRSGSVLGSLTIGR